MGALAVALLLVAASACDRGAAPAYDGDPEGRIVTAGVTADELVTRGETARRIAEVELDAGLVERWFTAQERLDELAAADTDVRALLDGRNGDRSGRESAIEHAVRRLERDDRVRGVIEEAGLSTREYVMTALALHQALLASAAGAPRDLRSLAARNVRFVDRHAGLLERLAMPRPPRTLVYADTFAYDTTMYGEPLVDTISPYDDVPYDPDADPDADPDPDADVVDSLAWPPYDTGVAPTPVPPPPTIDTLRPTPPPPIVVPPVPPAGSTSGTPRPVRAPAAPPASPPPR